MQALTNILQTATAAIEPMYFRLSIDGGDPIYRERVYCYELYHQMRVKWPDPCSFYLNGEVDKVAHPKLSALGAKQKPDLLVHSPGHMNGNHAIIEIKNCQPGIAGIKKDLETLVLFRSRVGYERAIYLLYGDQSESTAKRVERAAERLGPIPPLELWIHHSVGMPAQQIATLGITRS